MIATRDIRVGRRVKRRSSRRLQTADATARNVAGIDVVRRFNAHDLLCSAETACLTTSTKPHRIEENFGVSTLPEDAMSDIRNRITTNVRWNTVVHTGVPGFIPRPE
jgi:hypothetical protein